MKLEELILDNDKMYFLLPTGRGDTFICCFLHKILEEKHNAKIILPACGFKKPTSLSKVPLKFWGRGACIILPLPGPAILLTSFYCTFLLRTVRFLVD